jgi:hypothetical protein
MDVCLPWPPPTATVASCGPVSLAVLKHIVRTSDEIVVPRPSSLQPPRGKGHKILVEKR